MGRMSTCAIVQSEGGAAPGVAVSAALADLGRTKAWTSLVLDSLASRWLQQQVRPRPPVVKVLLSRSTN